MAMNKDTKAGPSATPGYFVHIIESPSPNDLLDGRAEGRLLTEALSLAGIISRYNLATSYSTFLQALGTRLYAAMREVGGSPILHLSTHGNEEGIELTDLTFVQWEQLRDLLFPINKVLNGGLVVCMSSCSGYSGCRMAMSVSTEVPFFGLVGHIGMPVLSDTAVAFVTFYHRFFRGTAVPDAVKAMCIASGDNGFLEILGSKARETWVQHIEKQRQQEMQERFAKILDQYRRQQPPTSGVSS